jgi:mitochondrial fission protein ELM1
MESQCVGLAEALGLKPIIKRVRLRPLWEALSPYLNSWKSVAISSKGDALEAPWPDIVIASGRQSILPSLYVQQRTGGRSFHVQIQNPVIDTQKFDAVVVPAHDHLQGSNIINMEGALHRVTPELLQAEAQKWAPTFAHLKRPYVAVLLGGSNANYRLDPKVIMQLGPQLTSLAAQGKASLLITPSRRTGAMNSVLLSALLHNVPAYLWDEQGENPYYGMLGLADSIIVTCDSINMISEACATGKPVHVVKLPGTSEKFNAFYQALQDSGRIRFFSGTLENWTYSPLREMQRVASLIRAAYEKH